MKRMPRIISNRHIVLSWLPFVAAVVLWMRTITGPPIDFYVAVSPGRSHGLGTERGAIIGFLQQERPSYRDNDPGDVQVRRLGFRYLRITSDGMRRWNLVLPLWLLTCIAAAWPVSLWLRRREAARKLRLGMCPVCGYDLRATPDRCPECGTVQAG